MPDGIARDFQEKLKAVQETSLQLVFTETIDQLCAKAIELGRANLEFDRVGLLMFENAEKNLVSR